MILSEIVMSMLRALRTTETEEYFVDFDDIMMIEIEAIASGNVLYPWDLSFAKQLEEIKEFDGNINGEPTIIVSCESTEQLEQALKFAEKYQLGHLTRSEIVNNKQNDFRDKILINSLIPLIYIEKRLD